MILDVPLPGIEPWEEVKANPVLWHVGFHQTPDLPEKLLADRQFVYFRDGIFNRFTANSRAITDVALPFILFPSGSSAICACLA
jgi:hypothetical protein